MAVTRNATPMNATIIPRHRATIFVVPKKRSDPAPIPIRRVRSIGDVAVFKLAPATLPKMFPAW
jgi:hypothetical protein